jgi:hypothetical protein
MSMFECRVNGKKPAKFLWFISCNYKRQEVLLSKKLRGFPRNYHVDMTLEIISFNKT